MPWKECSVMDERLRFVAKLLDGEAMSGLCREFGISRKTGYKIFNRYKESGFGSYRPHRDIHGRRKIQCPHLQQPDKGRTIVNMHSTRVSTSHAALRRIHSLFAART